MEPDTVIQEIELNMQSALENLNQEYQAVRTGKATPALVENVDIVVASYGTSMKLRELAVITAPEPRCLIVQPFDPTTLGDMDKGIRESNLGMNPVSDGKMLRIPLPEPSEERRLEMVKRVKSLSEDAKVRLRAVRKEGMDSGKKMKNDNLLTEDSLRDFEAKIQEFTDKHVKLVDEATAQKEKDVMTV